VSKTEFNTGKGYPRMRARQIPREELTLTERVRALERGHEELRDRIAVIEAYLGRESRHE
jgi:hypothetical protein